jgi:subtilisin-like proprotein convertase family protein
MATIQATIAQQAPASRILLNSGTIDTNQPAAQLLRSGSLQFSGRRLHLIQFHGPVASAWLEQLSSSGITIVDAIPENAYLIYASAAQLRQLQSDSNLQWEGPLRPSFRIAPALQTALTTHNNQPQRIQIQLIDDPATNAATIALLHKLRSEPMEIQSISHYVNIITTIPANAIDQIAQQPDVISIHPYELPQQFDERQLQIIAGAQSGNGPSAGDYLAWLDTLGLSQAQFSSSGFVVDVTDSGLDDGTTSPNHPALYEFGNTSLASRVAYARLEGRHNNGGTIAGTDGHGTLNAHIIAGYVPSSAPYRSFPHADAQGFRYGLGVAPFVRVGSSVIFDPSSFTYPNYRDMVARAYRDGARISANSWGSRAQGAYTADAQTYDYLVRDAQPSGSAVAVAGNQELTFVFAAGNGGSSAQTIGAPGSAKNVITVGASEGVHAFPTPDGCGYSNTAADNLNDLASFSSRGPTSDGRIKPDLIAPGTHITGGAFQAEAPGANGTAGPGFDGEGVCGGSANSPFLPSGQQWYIASTGTSHSTPVVAGAAALVRQYFINHGWPAPSPAMTKAILVSGTQYLNGVATGGSLPSNNQGMGLLNLTDVLSTTPRLLFDQQERFGSSGQSRQFVGTIADTNRPTRISLAWTDAPGSTIGAAYLNNLDLEVQVGGQIYYGNVFVGANSVEGGNPDGKNNLESVFLPAGIPAGTAVVITIRATSLIADGVPGNVSMIDQDFALVGLNIENNPSLAIIAEDLQIITESLATNGVADPHEQLTIRLTLRNAGSNDANQVEATLLSAGGALHPSRPQNYGLLAANGTAVARDFSLIVDPDLICGDSLQLVFEIKDDDSPLGQIRFTLATSTRAEQQPQQFDFGNTITLPDSARASIYPATIAVQGVSGQIGSVQVHIHGLSHDRPSDLHLLLVSPGGSAIMLMAGVGGVTPTEQLELTFRDDASAYLEQNISNGAYRPSDASTSSMLDPAPKRPYSDLLAALVGEDPNGTWQLYARDARSTNSGQISDGWSLSITTSAPSCPKPSVVADPPGLVTTEQGGSDTLMLALNGQPRSDVTLQLAISNSEVLLSTSTITFGPDDWAVPQAILLTGVDDGVADGNRRVELNVSLSSSDPSFDGQLLRYGVINREAAFEVVLPLLVQPANGEENR